jgi:N-acetyl-gamma-glutamyl-phosphate reductase
MKYKIFVDGQEGTTGLKIHERLSKRDDIEILKIEPELRKDPGRRKEILNESDLSFLCLPDEASRESVSLITNGRTRVIDTSTAFRTDPSWTYGLAELNGEQRGLIRNSKKVAVPGCHATGFVMAVYPLVREKIILPDYPVVCQSITGYSGGGKKLIEQYESTERDNDRFKAPRLYSLKLKHKHIPEMQKYSGLSDPPLFIPVISNYFQGMVTSVPLFKRKLNRKMSPADIAAFYAEYYKSESFVEVKPYDSDSNLDNGYLNAIECNGTNRFQMFVFGNDEQILVSSRFDNLGKGASGAAMQNMNIMLGLDERTGLV